MKNNKKYVAFLALFAIASFILLSSCYAPTNLQSKWRDKDIVIDGDDNEWQDCQLYVDQITQTNLGIYNDDAYMYICFSTMDSMIQKEMVSQGFFIWFDETGGRNKSLGIRYPIGGQSIAVGNTYSVSELQIFLSEEDTGKTLEISEAAKLDINARIATDLGGEKLIYELKMPLKYVTPSEPNKIALGVMTSRPAGRSSGGISGFGGTGVSQIGANTGGATDMMPSAGSDMGSIKGGDAKIVRDQVAPQEIRGKPIEIWANLLLASKP